MTYKLDKPMGAQFYHFGLYYKKGVQDFVYFYDEPTGQWVKSSKDWYEVSAGEVV